MQPIRLLTYGLGLIVIALVSWAALPVSAQDDELEYIGARDCRSCHRDVGRPFQDSPHALTLQNSPEAIVADFEQGADLRTLQFPGENQPRPFTPEDVAFTLGSGRHAQAYLYEVARNDYVIFPAQWNVARQAWEPLSLAPEWPDEAYAFGPNCAGCHTVGLDVERYRWQDDGVQCEACHGPGSLHADLADEAGSRPNDEELKAIRTAIFNKPDAQVCGQCHSQGTEPLANHPYPISYLPGQDLLAEGVFSLVDTQDATHYWATGHGNHPNMQFNEWLSSAHANSLASLQDQENADSTCLSCHSADYAWAERLAARTDSEVSLPTLAAAEYGVTCASCHTIHPTEDQAQPASSAALCMACHSNPEGAIHHPVREMFTGEAFIEEVAGVPGAHFQAADGPDCATCHLPAVPVETQIRASHTMQPILPGSAIEIAALQDSCTGCHTIDAAAMQQLIDDTRSGVENRLLAARAELAADSPTWAIMALDFIEGDGSRGVHNYAYTDSLLDAVELELGLTVPVAPTPDFAQMISLPAAEPESSTPQRNIVIPAAGLSTTGLVILGIVALILAVAAYAFFVRRPTQ
jgi:5-methylcytosine-specific restriction endonuclease McrA